MSLSTKDVSTYLGMPDVKDTGVGGSHDFHMTFDVLPVQHDVFSTPANDFLVKTAYS
jgi:hypothetical protein